MAEATIAHLALLERERSPANMKQERSRANGIKNDDEMAAMLVDRVDMRAVARWTERLGMDRSPRTVNRYLSLGSKVWRYARKHGYVPEDRPNPFRLVDRAEEPDLDKDPLTPKQAAVMVKAADEDFRPLFVAALATGCRRGELLTLTWGCVDIRESEIVITPEHEKAGNGRHVPMTKELRVMLRQIKRTRGPVLPSAPVFVTARGRPHTDTTVRRRVAKLREAKIKAKDARLQNEVLR